MPLLAPVAGAFMLLAAACAPVTYIPENQPAYVQGPPPQPNYYPGEGPPRAPAYYPENPSAPVYAPPAEVYAPPAPDPLDHLMAPVALYPDPLISILLPASTFPSDIGAAGAYLNSGGDPGQVDGQPWDPSVRSLAHYPEVVKWMAQNPQWTSAVGSAFIAQPADVMRAIQRLRELARAAGTLTSTPQQQVVVASSYIEIEPAQPDVIYVPRYDPEVVYVDQPYYGYHGSYMTYGPAYASGIWLTYGSDWYGGSVVLVDEHYWHEERGEWRHHDRDREEFSHEDRDHRWRFPDDHRRPEEPTGWRERPQEVQPRLISGAPPRPPESASRDIHTRGPAAVAAVTRDPGSFRGAPLNPLIIPRSPGLPAQRTAPSQRTDSPQAQGPGAAPNRAAPQNSPGRPERAGDASPRPSATAPTQPRAQPEGAPARPNTAPQYNAPRADRPAAPTPRPFSSSAPQPQLQAPPMRTPPPQYNSPTPGRVAEPAQRPTLNAPWTPRAPVQPAPPQRAAPQYRPADTAPRTDAPRPAPRAYPPQGAPDPRLYAPQTTPAPRVYVPQAAPAPRVYAPQATPAPRVYAQPLARPDPPRTPPPATRYEDPRGMQQSRPVPPQKPQPRDPTRVPRPTPKDDRPNQ